MDLLILWQKQSSSHVAQPLSNQTCDISPQIKHQKKHLHSWRKLCCRAALCMVNIKRKKFYPRSGHKNDEDRPGCCYQQNPCQVIRLNWVTRKIEKSSDTQLCMAIDTLRFFAYKNLFQDSTNPAVHCYLFSFTLPRIYHEIMVLLKISLPLT